MLPTTFARKKTLFFGIAVLTIIFMVNLLNPFLFSRKKLTRNYPEFVKCSWIYFGNAHKLIFQTKKLKKLGMNAVCIMIELPQYTDRPEFFYKLFSWTTKKAILNFKKAGLAVFLVPDASGPDEYRKTILAKISVSEFLDTLEQMALEWADIAEKYQVEYYAPHNEFNSKLDFPDHWFTGEDAVGDRIRVANNWHQQILPKIRQIYKGKVIAKYGTFEPGLKSPGFDLIGLTIGHNMTTDLKEYRNGIKEYYQNIIAAAKEDNIDWLVSEAFFDYEEPTAGEDIKQQLAQKGNVLKNQQDNYIKISFEEISALPKKDWPSGYIISGYGPAVLGIGLTETSKAVVKDFFINKIN